MFRCLGDFGVILRRSKDTAAMESDPKDHSSLASLGGPNSITVVDLLGRG